MKVEQAVSQLFKSGLVNLDEFSERLSLETDLSTEQLKQALKRISGEAGVNPLSFRKKWELLSNRLDSLITRESDMYSDNEFFDFILPLFTLSHPYRNEDTLSLVSTVYIPTDESEDVELSVQIAVDNRTNDSIDNVWLGPLNHGLVSDINEHRSLNSSLQDIHPELINEYTKRNIRTPQCFSDYKNAQSLRYSIQRQCVINEVISAAFAFEYQRLTSAFGMDFKPTINPTATEYLFKGTLTYRDITI